MSTLTPAQPDLSHLERRLRDQRDLPSPARRKRLRERAGLSRLDVARAVGVTRNAILYWETGRSEPRGENLARYVEVLRQLGAAS
jgi:DNA-binding XRE family transcriptional regulator